MHSVGAEIERPQQTYTFSSWFVKIWGIYFIMRTVVPKVEDPEESCLLKANPTLAYRYKIVEFIE